MISPAGVPIEPNATFFAKLLGEKNGATVHILASQHIRFYHGYKASERVPNMSDRKQNLCQTIHGTKL
jgi:hypothetical protein